MSSRSPVAPISDDPGYQKFMDDIGKRYKDSSAVDGTSGKEEDSAGDSAEPDLGKLSPRDRALAMQLTEALECGQVKTNSALGLKFSRSLTEEERRSYKQCKNDKLRAEFRRSWAERTLEGLEVCKQHTNEWKRVDSSRGTYETLASIAMKFGYMCNPGAALASAQVYCGKCHQMGGQWEKWDAMSEQVLFLFMKTEYSEQFTRAWSQFEVYRDRFLDSHDEPEVRQPQALEQKIL